jgi:hypothetical protein
VIPALLRGQIASLKLRYLAQIPRHQMLMVVAGAALVLVVAVVVVVAVAVAVIVERKPF